MKKVFMVGLVVMSAIIGCENTNSDPYVDTNSFDYKYSKTRFKMEGYSDKDSDIAARAIMKFNAAQKK